MKSGWWILDNTTNSADSSSDKQDKAVALISKWITGALNSATDLTYVSKYHSKVKIPQWDMPAVTEARRDMIIRWRLATKNKDSAYNKTKQECRQNVEEDEMGNLVAYGGRSQNLIKHQKMFR